MTQGENLTAYCQKSIHKWEHRKQQPPATHNQIQYCEIHIIKSNIVKGQRSEMSRKKSRIGRIETKHSRSHSPTWVQGLLDKLCHCAFHPRWACWLEPASIRHWQHPSQKIRWMKQKFRSRKTSIEGVKKKRGWLVSNYQVKEAQSSRRPSCLEESRHNKSSPSPFCSRVLFMPKDHCKSKVLFCSNVESLDVHRWQSLSDLKCHRENALNKSRDTTTSNFADNSALQVFATVWTPSNFGISGVTITLRP